MKLTNSILSVSISLLITAGMFMSVAHNHGHTDYPVDDFEYQFVQDSNTCAVCASHFKVNFGPDLSITSSLYSADAPKNSIRAHIVAPAFNLHHGRAPPVQA
ncbi:MAG: hypothetical protein GVY08_14840 [Bacteroidetes bacterium]|nr:hypothetical protein [Bacteroidota bacterium]